MRAHDAKDRIVLLSELVHEGRREPPPTVLFVHNELRDPADGPALVFPAARESLTRQLIVDDNPDVRAFFVGEVLCHEALLAELHGLPCRCLC